jgi:16S rRNA U516 pseudouridylate synthase RsuA-like enzyme
MLRRITYTVGWLTMAVPAQVRGCANVGALTALDVPAQSERRSAKIEASPQMDSLVWSEIQMDRSSARLTASQSQPTDGAITDRRQRFQPGQRSPKSNKYHCGHCGFRSRDEDKVRDHWVEKHGMAADEAARVMTAQNPDLSLDAPARQRHRSTNTAVSKHWGEKHGMGRDEAARVMKARNPYLSLDKLARRGHQPKRKPGEYNAKFKTKHGLSSDEAVRVTAARAKERRAGRTDSKHNPRRLACAHCAFTTLSRDSMIYHCAEKHGLAADGVAPVLQSAPIANDCDGPSAAAAVDDDGLVGPQRETSATDHPTSLRVTPSRRSAQFRFKPGEYNPEFKVYHCGHCSRRSTSEMSIRNHWVEKHGMSTEEAARVMAAQNPDIALDASARRVKSHDASDRHWRYKPGERSPKSNAYHCGHCGFRSPYEGKVQVHWVEKHGMTPDDAARVMAAQNSDLSLDKPARRGPQPKHKPGEYNAKSRVYQCGHCSHQSTSEQVIRSHWVEKHGMATEEAASVMAAQNPDLILDKPARRGAQFKFKPGERNPRNNHYHCGHCGFSWSNALKVCNHWVEKHGMARDEAVSVMMAQNPDVSLDKRARLGPQPKRKPGEYNPKFKLYQCGHCSRQSTSEQVIRKHWVEKHGMATEEAASVMAAQNPDLILDKPARQFKFNPGEYNPEFKVNHCGHCSHQSSSEQVIRNHWVEKHAMSTEEAASVMAAQNPDLSLDTPARRGPQRKRKPGEYNPKFQRYHCGHCSHQSSSERSIRDHWVEKHGMATEEAARVMTAQNPDVSLDTPARRGPQPKHKPGEYNPKFKVYHCGHCSRQSTSEQVIRDHWVDKHGMAAEEAARVMAAQNPSPST